MTANTKASKPGSWETRDPVLKEEEEEAGHSRLLFDHMYTAQIVLAGPPTPLVTSSKISCQVPHGYIVQTALTSRNTIGPTRLSVKGSAAQVSWCTDQSPLKRILGQCSKKKLPAQGEGLTPSFISKTEIQANLSPNAVCAQVCKHCLCGFTTLESGSSLWFLRWSQPWQTASPTVIHHVPD